MTFLSKLEKHTIDIKEQDLDSLNLIRDFLSSHQCLYEGVELIIHIIGIAAIKISVESVVSRYEIHFDKERQLTEEHALNEMEIVENGPKFANADRILKAAMNMYWEKKTFSGEWHITHRSEDIRTYSGKSKVMTKLMNETSKLSFMQQ